MKKYDFDQVIDRRGTGSLKWDEAPEGVIPLWVADMDFPTAPSVREAISERAAHGIFGYSILPDAWADAYIGWWRDRHHLDYAREELIFCTGVVPAISSAVRKLTTPAENVLIQTPVYNIFYNSILNNGRRVLESPLIYEDGEYAIDWEDLERKLADPQTSLMILCNPHNPIGKIWDKETLARIGELAARHGVTVLSDEIHCDLCDPGREYVPFFAASETCRQIGVTCIAPTKCFNLAGIQTAAVAVKDRFLRHKMWRALNTDEVAEPNAFAVSAAIAAFGQGGEWLDELRGYLAENKAFVRSYLKDRCPALTVVPSEATYLLWIDCSALTGDSRKLAGYLTEKHGVFLSDGAQYGEAGRSFLRLNTACPRKTLEMGLARLAEGLLAYPGDESLLPR